MTASQPASPPPVIDWAVCGRPIAGGIQSGDLHIAATYASGALVGVIDGLGHGKEASTAAHAAADALTCDPRRPITTLVETCHHALRGTRGVVLSLASINAPRGELTWVGVGNVEALLYRAGATARPVKDRIVQRNGVVGYRLPALRIITMPIFPDDVLVFGSDGLKSDFANEAPLGRSSEAYAECLLNRYGRADDDALVLVVRYLGAPP